MKLLIVLPLLFSSALAHNFTISLSSQPSRVKRAISSDCGCGRTSLRPQNRIVGGEEAVPHSIPYQAYIKSYYRISPSRVRVGSCGGTLLNKRYVLTAMHCLVNKHTGKQPTKVEVILGEHALHRNSEATQKFSASVIGRDDFKRHEGYLNDIAILKLDKDAELDEHVIPACLPSNENELYVDKTAKVSGWGHLWYKGEGSDVLMETNVTIIAQSDLVCKQPGILWEKPPTQMCAYEDKTDTCQGDSGGPMAVQENGKYTVVGVVSYGRGCALPGHAGVYARVTKYLPWIRENIADGWCDGSSGPTQAPTTQGLTCSNNTPACNFEQRLREWMNDYQSGSMDRIHLFDFEDKWIRFQLPCDLATGMCCAPRGFAHC